MSYYHTCPHCGANLDPGEKCDCNEDDKEDKNGSTHYVRPLSEENRRPKKKLYILGREVWASLE